MAKRPPNADETSEGFNAEFNYPQYDGDEESVEQILAKRQKTGGRTAGTPNKMKRFELQRQAQMYSLRAFATVIQVMEDEREGGAVRLAAAKEVLDRGFGRAKQMVEVGGIDGEDIQHRLVVEFIGQPPLIQNTHNHGPSSQSFVVNPGAQLPASNPGANQLNTLTTAAVEQTDIHPLTAARMRGAFLKGQPNQQVTDAVQTAVQHQQATQAADDADSHSSAFADEQVVVPEFKKPWE